MTSNIAWELRFNAYEAFFQTYSLFYFLSLNTITVIYVKTGLDVEQFCPL